jgi:hypothetical protein
MAWFARVAEDFFQGRGRIAAHEALKIAADFHARLHASVVPGLHVIHPADRHAGDEHLVAASQSERAGLG